MFQSFNHLLVGALAAAAAAVPALVQGYSNPGACSGACWAHDPAIIQRASDGKYFKFNTGGNIEIATASTITGPWTLQGFVLTNGSSIVNPGSKDCWAPDVSLVNGVYHLYYAVSTFGTQNSSIGLATSRTLDPGSWTDLGATGVSSTKGDSYNAIDPNLMAVGSSYYLNFGSFWHDIYQVELNTAATRAGGAAACNIQFNSTGSSPSEGSFMFNHDGYYYLTWSHGKCCGYDKTKPAAGTEYKIMMCRSESATGSFVDKHNTPCTKNGGSVLLESHGDVFGPGGQGLYNDKTLGPVLYYHYANTRVGLSDGAYLFGWNVLKWSDDKWPSV